MATSSIFESVQITNPQQVEVFLDALEASKSDREREPRRTQRVTVASADKVKELQAKRRAHR